MRVELQDAYILHTRPYTDTRILVDVFSREHGRLGGVARAAKKGGRLAVLRPFQPLLVSWQGKGELKTLTQVESAGQAEWLAGTRLYCGIYLNELLLRTTAVADPHPAVFEGYRQALAYLAADQPLEPVLRLFELDLLAELGYGISFDTDAESGEAIEPDGRYRFLPASGFVALENSRTQGSFVGSDILAIGQGRLDAADALQAAKRLCRLALQPLLGDKPLKSRELFQRAE